MSEVSRADVSESEEGSDKDQHAGAQGVVCRSCVVGKANGDKSVEVGDAKAIRCHASEADSTT